MMPHLIKEIEYKGFKIVHQRATDGSYFFVIKSDDIKTTSYLASEKAAMNVIDTYIKSLKK